VQAFGGHRAVHELSLSVSRGSVFGLLGQRRRQDDDAADGQDILAPDAGDIEILGHPADRAARDRIGYMPEERSTRAWRSESNCCSWPS
jgi:ABC-2 type transport system ATP-binding protein